MPRAGLGPLARLGRRADLDDQMEACRRVFASDTTMVRSGDRDEGESQGLPVWSRHVGDSIRESNLTVRVDFARFIVAALVDDALIHEAPAVVSRGRVTSARAQLSCADTARAAWWCRVRLRLSCAFVRSADKETSTGLPIPPAW